MAEHIAALRAARVRSSIRQFSSPPGSADEYDVVIEEIGGDVAAAYTFEISGPDASRARKTRRYSLTERSQSLYLDLLAEIGHDFGLRIPVNRQPAPVPTFEAASRLLLGDNLSSTILYGYGDPAVLRVGTQQHDDRAASYYAVLTSNDAPDSFPIIRSVDLWHWEHLGFAFPSGRKPQWAAEGESIADYWAPELHRVGDQYVLVFTARDRDTRELCIGLATSTHPGGPFTPVDSPLLTGGRIDPHLLVEPDGTLFLYWKDDRNDAWRNALNELIFDEPHAAQFLFPADVDRRTASLVATLWPWTRELEPMERFVQEVLIEAVTSNFAAFERRLESLRKAEQASGRVASSRRIGAVRKALKTPVYAQQLTRDFKLIGQPTKVLENDQPWEGHVVEGMWVVPYGGRYYMFYSGNNFSTPEYGIGAAVADSPLGPFTKFDHAVLRSTRDWCGPGHPSVAVGPTGEHILFFHAFVPGKAGYKEFRALMAIGVEFTTGAPRLKPLSVKEHGMRGEGRQ